MTSFDILRRRVPKTNACALSQFEYYPKGLVERTPVVQGFEDVRIQVLARGIHEFYNRFIRRNLRKCDLEITQFYRTFLVDLGPEVY